MRIYVKLARSGACLKFVVALDTSLNVFIFVFPLGFGASLCTVPQTEYTSHAPQLTSIVIILEAYTHMVEGYGGGETL